MSTAKFAAKVSPRILFQRQMKEKRILFQEQVKVAQLKEKNLKIQRLKEEEERKRLEEKEIKEYKRSIKTKMEEIDRNVQKETKVDHLTQPVPGSTRKTNNIQNTPKSILRAARKRNFLKAREEESIDRQKRLLYLYQSAKNFVTYQNMSEKIDQALSSVTLSTSTPYKRDIDFKRLDFASAINNGRRSFLLKDILAGRYMNEDDLDTVKQTSSRIDATIEEKIVAFKAKVHANSKGNSVDSPSTKN